MSANGRPAVTEALAEFVATYPGDAIPQVAIDQVRRAFLDLAGVTIIGYTEPAGRHIRRYVQGQGASGPCTLIGGGVRLSASMAALANGTAGHAFDFDDIGVRAGHVSVAMMPAVIAVAEMTEASGRSFVESMVLGYEIANRLTRLYDDSIDGPYAAGFHKPSVYAVFGGTAAVCRLLGLDGDRIRLAFGIAASQSGGLRVNFGTMTKPMHAGIACRTAVEASLLAGGGFTASAQSLEGRFGWFEAICRGEGDLERVIDGLGDSFAVEEGLRFKLYPCCGANHAPIEGLLTLLDTEGLSEPDVETIDVHVDPRNLDVLVYPWPRSGLEGKFSLPYNIAAALVDRAVTVQTFVDAEIPRLAQVRSRIRTHADPSVPRDGVVITVRTADGRELTHAQDSLRGNVGQALSWSDLVTKFTHNVRGLLPHELADAAVKAVDELDSADAVSDVTRLLIGGSPGTNGERL